jgi:hypothetical protein
LVVALDALFSESNDGVLADWYTGEPCCPMGEFLYFVSGGFASIYEYDFFLAFKQGVILGERVVVNGEAETLNLVRDAVEMTAEDKLFSLFRKKHVERQNAADFAGTQ